MEEFYSLIMIMTMVPTIGCLILALANIKTKTYYKYSGHRWVKKR